MKINTKLALCLLISSASLLTKKTFSSATCTNFGPIKITTTDGTSTFQSGTVLMHGDIQIGQGATVTDKITLKSGKITNPSTGIIVGLAIDENGELVSSEKEALTIFGDNSNSFISIDNATSGTQDITLNAGTSGEIKIQGTNINPNASTEPTLVQMDQNNNLFVRAVPNITCGALIAGESGYGVKLGGTLNTGYNTIYLASDTGDVSIQADVTSANLNLKANQYINITAGNITNPSTGNTANLGIDENGNLITISGGAQTFTDITAAASTTEDYNVALGNTTSGNALSFTNNTGDLTLQANVSGSNLNLTANSEVSITGATVSITGDLTLTDTSLLPTAGCTNAVTINENGKLGIVVSTAAKKKNITDAETLSWDNLQAHNYSYLNSDRTEFGYIAEELAETKEWGNFVIYNKENKPMSVNYNGIFVAAMHIAKTKITQAEAKISSLEQEISSKSLSLEKMENKFTELEEQYKILAEEIAQFKIYKQIHQNQ